MKVDEVSGVPELPQIRSGDVARETELAKQNVQPPTPPDQVVISQAARFAPETDQAARVAKLQQELGQGLKVRPQEIAKALVKDQVVG